MDGAVHFGISVLRIVAGYPKPRSEIARVRSSVLQKCSKQFATKQTSIPGQVLPARHLNQGKTDFRIVPITSCDRSALNTKLMVVRAVKIGESGADHTAWDWPRRLCRRWLNGVQNFSNNYCAKHLKKNILFGNLF